jgi:hypothetical protein
MKLNTTRPNIESSGFIEEQFFSIKDQGMIFDILRSKMYSNPILAICREISCNARDAHREVGKADVPVVIVLPNQLDWSYRIKDVGPGISPDRMSNIFIQYTASTKRDDNLQTGGFGLGCKTPFSYSDSFNVITVHNRIKYQYTCFIDETKVGKLILHSQESTDDANGTEIVIPVEPKDAVHFIGWTEQACRHWDVKPIIKGGNIQWHNPKKIISGEGWAFTQTLDAGYRQAKMIIDGIEYPLDLSALRTYADSQLIDACSGDVLMYFGVGELSLSASREQIYLDKKTQDIISNRLKEINKEVRKLIEDKIDTFPDLWQANLYYRKELSTIFTNLHYLGKLYWKGNLLANGPVYTNCPVFQFTRGKYSRKSGLNPDKLNRTRGSSFSFTENSQLYINDLPIKEPTPRHVKKAFDDNPKLQSIHVVCPTDAYPESRLNTEFYLDKMLPKRLSDVTKATGRTYTPAAQRLLVFKFDPVSHAYRQVSYSSIDEDVNNKVLSRLSYQNHYTSGRLPLLKNNRTLSLDIMTSIMEKSSKTSFYGIDQDISQERVDEDLSDFQMLDDYIEKNILKNKNINYLEIRFATDNVHEADERIIKNLSKMESKIKNPDSLFLKRARLHKKIRDINASDTGLLKIYELIKGELSKSQLDQFLVDNPELNIQAVNELYETTYPLLTSINLYNYANLIEPVAQYVNLIDTHG